jgi:ribose 5-phosphate isomerase A
MKWIVIASSEKLVDQLGTRIRLPVEIIPFGWEQTARYVDEVGVDAQLRITREGEPFVTDGGHYILDCMTGGIENPAELSAALKQVTGVVDHGLFIGLANASMTIDEAGVVTTRFRSGRYSSNGSA